MLSLTINSDTVWIHPRRGGHYITHSEFQFRYSMDTPQARRSFYYSFRLQQTVTARIRSRHGRHSFAHMNPISRYTPDTDTILVFILLIFSKQSWMASLSPSPAIFYHLQMASLSPFPHLHFDECKFTGTLVSNPLLPSSHERPNSPI